MPVQSPSVFVAFGVTGDLMAQKILPGLFALHDKEELPAGFEVWGVSRRDWSEEKLREHVTTSLGEASSAPRFPSFVERFKFMQGDASEPAIFETLAKNLGGRYAIFYFSLPPTLYKDAFT